MQGDAVALYFFISGKVQVKLGTATTFKVLAK